MFSTEQIILKLKMSMIYIFFAIVRCLTDTDMLLSETPTYTDVKSFR